MNPLSILLSALPVVGPVVAAAPQFKALFDMAKQALSTEDQATASQAYDLAIQQAADAHTNLQDLVRRHS